MEGIIIFVFIILSIAAVVLITSQTLEERRYRQITPTRVDDLTTLINDDDHGSWMVSVYRQSGNPYKDDEIFSSKEDAIKQVMSTFKRSGEDSPVITRNIQGLVEFKRWGLVHDEHPNGYNSKIIGTIIISRM